VKKIYLITGKLLSCVYVGDRIHYLLITYRSDRQMAARMLPKISADPARINQPPQIIFNY